MNPSADHVYLWTTGVQNLKKRGGGVAVALGTTGSIYEGMYLIKAFRGS